MLPVGEDGSIIEELVQKLVMREKYESGLIRNEHEFKEVLNNVLSGSERS